VEYFGGSEGLFGQFVLISFRSYNGILNPFRYVAMHGPVIEMTEEGAGEHNDRLAIRCLGLEKFPGNSPPYKRPRTKQDFRCKPAQKGYYHDQWS